MSKQFISVEATQLESQKVEQYVALKNEILQLMNSAVGKFSLLLKMK